MIVKRALFLHVPRTGGTVVEQALLHLTGRPKPEHEPDIDLWHPPHYFPGTRNPAHYTWEEWQPHLPAVRKVVIVVRHPYERVASAYYFYYRWFSPAAAPLLSMDEFIRTHLTDIPDNFFTPTTTFIRGVPRALLRIVPYTRDGTLIPRVLRALGFRAVSVCKRPLRPPPPLECSPETLKIVQEHFREDFEQFNFQM